MIKRMPYHSPPAKAGAFYPPTPHFTTSPMPEGDTIFRAATTLRPAMEGGVIEHAPAWDGAVPVSPDYEQALRAHFRANRGWTATSLEARAT